MIIIFGAMAAGVMAVPVSAEPPAAEQAAEAPMEVEAPVAPGQLPVVAEKPQKPRAPTPEIEKVMVMQQLRKLQMTDKRYMAAWWSFTKMHADGDQDMNKHDTAFLETFLCAFEAGDVPEHPECPAMGGLANSVDPSASKVFIGGLPKAATEEGIKTMFEPYGGVETIDMKKDEKGEFRGFAFLTFADAELAKIVIEIKDAITFEGSAVDMRPAGMAGQGDKGGWGAKGGKAGQGWGNQGGWSGKGSQGSNWGQGGGFHGGKGGKGGGGAPASAPGTKVFVGGLPKQSTTEDGIRALFAPFGQVDIVDMKHDKETNEFRGFAFVTFSDSSVTQAVLAKKDALYMEGRWIDVKPADDNSQGGKGGGGGGGWGKSNNKGGNQWGNQGGNQGGNQWGNQGGNQGGWNSQGGNGWKSQNDNQGGSQWGNQQSQQGGNQWGNQSSNQGGNQWGNQSDPAPQSNGRFNQPW